MKAVRLYLAPVFVLVGGLAALAIIASDIGASVEQRARGLAARAFGEAQTHWQNQARDLVGEAAELARAAGLPAPEDGAQTLRWRVDASGKLTEGYGSGFEAGEPDISGMNAVARALQGVASDSVVYLAAGEQGVWWHLAAAPTAAGGAVTGAVVVGRRLALVAKGIGEQLSGLSAGGDMPVHAVLYDGRKVLFGKATGELTGMLKPGKVDGSVRPGQKLTPARTPRRRLAPGGGERDGHRGWAARARGGRRRTQGVPSGGGSAQNGLRRSGHLVCARLGGRLLRGAPDEPRRRRPDHVAAHLAELGRRGAGGIARTPGDF